jgi:hypothetical protein
MPNTCDNIIRITASNEEGKKELKEFKLESQSTGKLISFEPAFPMPEDMNIEIDSKAETGLAIIQYRNGDDSKLKKIFESEMYQEQGITSIQELEEHLLGNNKADLVLAQKAFDNLKTYGVKDRHDWRLKNWGVKCDANEVEVLQDNEGTFEVYFYSPWNPPYKWVVEVSKKYPALIFSDDYSITWTNTITEGLFEGENGKFFHEEVDLGFPSKATSDNLIVYNEDCELYQDAEGGNKLPFVFYPKYFKSHGYLIIAYRNNYPIINPDEDIENALEKKILLSILQKRKEEEGDIVKYRCTVHDNNISAYYLFRVECNTLSQAVKMSNLVVNDINEEYTRATGKIVGK